MRLPGGASRTKMPDEKLDANTPSDKIHSCHGLPTGMFGVVVCARGQSPRTRISWMMNKVGKGAWRCAGSKGDCFAVQRLKSGFVRVVDYDELGSLSRRVCKKTNAIRKTRIKTHFGDVPYKGMISIEQGAMVRTHQQTVVGIVLGVFGLWRDPMTLLEVIPLCLILASGG